MLIDTHSHLNFKAFSKDYKEVIKKALDEDVWMINVGSNFATSKRAVEIAEEFKEGVYAAIGLHPIHSQDEEFDVSKYLKLAKSAKVVAIGETGLDYYHNEAQKEVQKNVFIKQLKLAEELGKPVIVHCREAHSDLIDLLKEHLTSKGRGVVHCFMGRWSQAQEYFNLGFLISFTGVITYVNDFDKVIRNTPLEKLMVDTDSPYMAPEPFRGKRNEPRYCKYIAQKIAEIKGVSFEKVAKVTTENARQLFSI